MNRTLTRKLIYIIAALVLLVGMLPITAVPVSAAAALSPAVSHDIIGDPARFTVTGLTGNQTVDHFEVHAVIGETGFAPFISGNSTTAVPPWVTVQSFVMGEAVVQAFLSDGTRLESDKKWGKIGRTAISPQFQDQVVVWNESTKSWTANATITDQVYGKYWLQNPYTALLHIWEFPGFVPQYDATAPFAPHNSTTPMTLGGEGAVMHWFLLKDNPATQAWVASHSGTMMPSTLLSAVIALQNRAAFTTFVGATGQTMVDSTHVYNTTGPTGTSTINVTANGEEPVLVIVVSTYPSTNEDQVVLEWAKINFWTSEMEKVPQVRWAGEKIVLEKFFGTGQYPTITGNTTTMTNWVGTPVRFSLENQSVGSLEGIGTLPSSTAFNLTNTQHTVWGEVEPDGYARCMMVSEAPGEVDVDLAVYNNYWWDRGQQVVLNQHGFVVFYLKFESITLGDVVGKRATSNAGLWTPPNPWDNTLDWEMVHAAAPIPEPLTVSADTLLRARVRGWFVGDNLSSRLAKTIDSDPTVETGNAEGVIDADPTNDMDMVLPVGRWILPDDWARLAGPDWAEQRIHWDIMNAPNDSILVGDPATAPDSLGLGSYYKPPLGTKLIAAANVVGPFRPGLEVPTATGYDPNIPGYAVPPQKTVVPNAALNWWDAPMPPAKITFEIKSGVGFFKDAIKSDIYYVMSGTTKIYTNPFYFEMIPAFSQIPAFVNNGGYDWDSWNTTQYGPYQFWDIFNRPIGVVPSTDSANYPTKAQVYSDNHGEAMVYLNGNWNLNLSGSNGHADIVVNTPVGSSSIVAMTDYPYFRKHPKLVSNPVQKTWLWGGQILGPDGSQGSPAPMVLVAGDSTNPNAFDYIHLTAGSSYTDPAAQGYSNKHVVWIWATDRNGMQAGMVGTRVDWQLSGAGAQFFDGSDFIGINPNPNSIALHFDGTGFLENTAHPGVRAPGTGVTSGSSWLRAPTAAEAAIFLKFYGPGKGDLDPLNFAVTAIDILNTGAGTVTVNENLTSPDFALPGFATGTIFRQTDFTTTVSYPLDDEILLGDANLDGGINTTDITAVERIILGMNQARVVQADANYDHVIDMADALRIQKTYFGLK